MFSKIKAFFVGVEQTIEHDVEAIISRFTDTVTKLEAAAVAKLAEAEEATKLADLNHFRAGVATAAADKASAVAAKIKALVA
jgi:hypothetical protein